MNYGTGALRDSYDPRDYQWKDIAKARGVEPFDWDKGFDLEETLGIKLKVKAQGTSSSCGGQAWSYYGEVLEFLDTKTYEPRSAKFIYANTVTDGGGSYGRDNCAFLTKIGWGLESITTSYENGNPPSEEFMTRLSDIKAEAYDEAKKNYAVSYANTGIGIDDVAQAIKTNHGVILGVCGTNDGNWTGIFPTPPKPTDTQIWAHWIYAIGAKKINGKKYIKVINSWGVGVGEGGYQWLSEDYFTTLIPQWQRMSVWAGWTMVFNNEEQKKAILQKMIEAYAQIAEILKKLISMK